MDKQERCRSVSWSQQRTGWGHIPAAAWALCWKPAERSSMLARSRRDDPTVLLRRHMSARRHLLVWVFIPQSNSDVASRFSNIQAWFKHQNQVETHAHDRQEVSAKCQRPGWDLTVVKDALITDGCREHRKNSVWRNGGPLQNDSEMLNFLPSANLTSPKPLSVIQVEWLLIEVNKIIYY